MVALPHNYHGLAGFLLAFLGRATAPLTVAVSLWMSLAVQGEPLTQPYQILMVIAALLAVLLFREITAVSDPLAHRSVMSKIGSIALSRVLERLYYSTGD